MSQLISYMVSENEWDWKLDNGLVLRRARSVFSIGVWLPISKAAGHIFSPTSSLPWEDRVGRRFRCKLRRSAAELDQLFEAKFKLKPWRFHETETATQTLVEMQEGQ